jgi:hypothetical protein
LKVFKVEYGVHRNNYSFQWPGISYDTESIIKALKDITAPVVISK